MYIQRLLVKTLALAIVAMSAVGFAAAADRPHMLYFYNPSCRLCTKSNEAVGAAEEKYKDRMTSQRFNIADTEKGLDNVLYMFELMDELEIPEGDNLTLVVFLGVVTNTAEGEIFVPRRILIEGEEIIEKLDAETADFIEKEAKGETAMGAPRPAVFFSHTALAATPPVNPEEASSASGDSPGPRRRGSTERAQTRAQAQLQFGAISAAALADSVNPCAFATIIILVAMMSSAKRTKKEIVAVCLGFTAAVFVTYFAIGLFLYKVIAWINENGGWFLVVADCIYYLAFLLCVVFAALALWDAYLLLSGRSAEEMVMQLPKAFKKRINVAMAKGVRARWLVVGVFLAGVTVSFFEAACTGQVYLPTIIALAKISFWHSMALLAWYNFLFVLPLLIIFGLVLLGVTSQQLADFFKKHVAWTKLALAAVFIIMIIVIWPEMHWPPGYRG